MGFWDVVPILIILALVVIPYWNLWQRTGHSAPGAADAGPARQHRLTLGLAFKKWPALDEEDRRQ